MMVFINAIYALTTVGEYHDCDKDMMSIMAIIFASMVGDDGFRV